MCRGRKPLASLFSTSALGATSMTDVIEDLQGLAISREGMHDGAGVYVFASPRAAPYPGSAGCGVRYWFLSENSCWTLVMDEVARDHLWGRGGRQSGGESGVWPSGGGNNMYSAKAERVLGDWLGWPAWREALGRSKRQAEVLVKVESYVTTLYGVFHRSPVVRLDLVSGQMWIVQDIRVELVDLVVAISCAALNVELAVKAATEDSAGHLHDSLSAATEIQNPVGKLDFRCL